MLSEASKANEQDSVDSLFSFWVFSACFASLVRGVSCAPHTLFSSVVNSIRTLEELSFNETRREETPIFD